MARIFNTYGPRMHPNDGRVVSNFIVSALEGQPITIYGDGSQTRSLCYVDDTIEALIRFMETADDVTGPINIGNPAEISIRGLAEKVIERTGVHVALEQCDLPTDDPKRRQPDIGRARELLDWGPKVQLEEGLDKTIAFFRELIAQRSADEISADRA